MKLTPWFVNGETSVRPGVYNVSCRTSDQSGEWWRYWDGQHWYHVGTSPKRAQMWYEDGLISERGLQGGSWRGIAKGATK